METVYYVCSFSSCFSQIPVFLFVQAYNTSYRMKVFMYVATIVKPLLGNVIILDTIVNLKKVKQLARLVNLLAYTEISSHSPKTIQSTVHQIKNVNLVQAFNIEFLCNFSPRLEEKSRICFMSETFTRVISNDYHCPPTNP